MLRNRRNPAMRRQWSVDFEAGYGKQDAKTGMGMVRWAYNFFVVCVLHGECRSNSKVIGKEVRLGEEFVT